MALLRILFLFCSILFLTSCSPDSAKGKEVPTVLVSVAPYAFFVKEIGGEHFRVKVLIPEGANPHTYEPKPQEVAGIQDAALWIRLKEPSEEKVYRVLLEQKPSLKILEITRGIPLLSASCCEKGHHHHPHDGEDLHVWLSPKLAELQASRIAEALISLDPVHETLYRQNLEHLLTKLHNLGGEIREILKNTHSKGLLVSHPAFAYFCQDYGLTQLSVEVEGKDPLPKQIDALLQKIEHHQIKTVFLEPQYSTKGAELLAEKLHLKSEMIDPYAEDYIENLREIALKVARS